MALFARACGARAVKFFFGAPAARRSDRVGPERDCGGAAPDRRGEPAPGRDARAADAESAACRRGIRFAVGLGFAKR